MAKMKRRIWLPGLIAVMVSVFGTNVFAEGLAGPLFLIQTGESFTDVRSFLWNEKSETLELKEHPTLREQNLHVQNSRKMAEKSASVVSEIGNWVFSEKVSLPARTFKSVQVLNEKTFLGLRPEGNIDFLTFDKDGGLIATKAIDAHSFSSQVSLLDFAVSPTRPGRVYLFYGGQQGTSILGPQRARFEVAYVDYTPEAARHGFSFQELLQKGKQGLDVKVSGLVELESMYDSFVHARNPDTKLDWAKIKQADFRRAYSPLERLYAPHQVGQKASEWIMGSTSMREHLKSILGAKGNYKMNTPVLPSESLNLEKELALQSFLDELVESGIHAADLKLDDIVWNGNGWVLTRLPSPSSGETFEPELLKKKYLKSLIGHTNDNACRLAFEALFGPQK